jgi:protein required for attachment to host cells
MATYEIVRPSELLAQLRREYQRVQQDHMREAPEGATRRRIEAEMERIARRFERLLAHWVSEDNEELRAAWRKHLHDGGPPPEQPVVETPRLFKGETEAGSRLEIVPALDGGHDVFVDGTRVEHSAVAWHLDPEAREPFFVGSFKCREVFDAPAEAQRALARFVAAGETAPPWRWVSELFGDGLIDSEFGLTPRGRRLVTPEAVAGPGQARYCVVAADAGRARILTLGTASPGDPTPVSLVEVADLTNPARRTRDGDLFSDTRPGLRRESATGPTHGVDDRRDSQRAEADRRFAEMVADEAQAAWLDEPGCHIVVTAPPKMLGSLRPAIARRMTGAAPLDVEELDKDLSRLSPPALHDALAEAGLLPARGRVPPVPGSSGFGAVRDGRTRSSG